MQQRDGVPPPPPPAPGSGILLPCHADVPWAGLPPASARSHVIRRGLDPTASNMGTRLVPTESGSRRQRISLSGTRCRAGS